MPNLVIKKIVREIIDLKLDANGKTYGQLIDESIASAIANHEELNEITFGFEGDQWWNFLGNEESAVYRNHAESIPVDYDEYGNAKARPRRK